MSDDNLDALLARPLAYVEDAGFSRRVTDGVAAMQRRHTYWTAAAAIVSAAIVLWLVPLGQARDAIGTLSWNLADSVPVGIAIAMLVLSNSLARWVAD